MIPLKYVIISALFVLLFTFTTCQQEEDLNFGNKYEIFIGESRILQIKMSEADFSKLRAPNNRIYNELYKRLDDEFDFILEIHDNKDTPANIEYSGACYTYSNDVEGIGEVLFNDADKAGSSGRLKAVISIPRNDGISANSWNLLLHEILHNWANYGIETYRFYEGKEAPDWAHWGLSGAGMILRGFDQKTLVSNIDGDSMKYSYTPPDNPFTTIYSNYELYLMGLLPLEDVEPFDVFSDLISDEGNHTFRAKTKVVYDNDLILSTLGPRLPSYLDSQKNFRMLVVFLTTKYLTSYQLGILDDYAEQFSRVGHDQFEDRINFWEATGGRAELIIEPPKQFLKEGN